MDFNLFEWQHGYLGLVILVIGLVFYKKQSKYRWWFIGIGGFIVADELSQIFIFGQYGGLLHWLYIHTLYKIDIIQEFNYFIDGITGKT